MNPNPYRTVLLAVALLGIVVGLLLVLIGATSSDLGTAFTLGAVGGYSFAFGASVLLIWLMVSAIIYGLTVSPNLDRRPTVGDWLGISGPSRGPGFDNRGRSETQTPSHLDEDGL